MPDMEPARTGWRVRNRFTGLNENTIAIAAMAAAMALFAANDALIKLAGQSIDVSQILLVRGAMASTLLFVLCILAGQFRALPKGSGMPVSMRLFAEVTSTFFFVTAIIHMPLGNTTAILQSLPLIMTLFAAIVLREHVGWRRWSAVLLGIIGMLMIVRPGFAGFDSYALWAVAAVFFITLRDLGTRLIPRSVPTLMVALLSMLSVTVMGAVLTWSGNHWKPLTTDLWMLLIAAALFLVGAFYSIVTAMRVGEVSAVAPYRYTILAWALIFGFFLFGEVPDGWAMTGIALIVGSGLYVFARERVLARKAR